MNKKPIMIIILVLMGIMLVPYANADFDVTYVTVNNNILHSDTVYYTLIVQNNLNSADTYRIFWTDVDWAFRTNPSAFYFSGFRLEAGERKEIEMQMRPSDILPYNTYFLPMDVISESSGLTKSMVLPVVLRSPTQEIGEYLTAVGRIVSVDPNQDPRNKLLLTINLRNRNPRNITEFKIIAFSPYFNVEEELPLPPLAERIIQLPVDLPHDLEPQRIPISVRFIADGKELYPQIEEFVTIIGYDDVTRIEEKKRGFFKTTHRYDYESKGNQETLIQDTHQTSFFTRPFSTILINGEKADRKVISNDSGQFLAWDISILPKQKVRIEIIYNYLLLFWIMVGLLIGLVFYQMMKSPIQTKKDAVVVGVTEGGISEIRVVIHLKNLSGKRYKTINVIDTIPKLAQFVPEKDDAFAATRLYHNQREGSAIKWTIDSLEKYEERIFTYRLRSKLSILGGLTLPRTLIRFTDEDQEQVTRSNSVRINL